MFYFLSLVYPNPSSGVFNVETHSDSHFEVIGMLGTVLLSGQISEQNSTLDLSKFEKVIYFLRLENQTIKRLKY